MALALLSQNISKTAIFAVLFGISKFTMVLFGKPLVNFSKFRIAIVLLS